MEKCRRCGVILNKKSDYKTARLCNRCYYYNKCKKRRLKFREKNLCGQCGGKVEAVIPYRCKNCIRKNKK